MVEIKKGTHKTKVTMGTYLNMFKPLGYTLVGNEKKETPKKPVKTDEVEKNTEPVKTDEVEKNAEPVKTDDFKGKNKKQED